MTPEPIRYRSDLVGTQVITRDTGKRLGVVSQIWVDVDRREVVAMGLRDSLIAGFTSALPRQILLNSIRQVGDVILVDTEDAIIDLETDGLSPLIRSEVVTETGDLLGRVHNFRFDLENGKVADLIISSFGLPQIPDQLISTYELQMEEVVSSGPERLVVFEGCEERLNQLTVGLLERLGIGRAPWERDEEDTYYTPVARPENRLGPGVPLRAPQNLRMPVRENWDEDTWEEEPAPPPARPRQVPIPEYREVDNWSEATGHDEYEVTPPPQRESVASQEEEPEDYWDEGETRSAYQPQKLNIPEKNRVPEYEE